MNPNLLGRSSRPARRRGRPSAQRWFAVTAGTAAAALALAACSAAPSGSSAASSSAAPAAAAAGVGAMLTTAEQSPPNSMNPALADQNPDFLMPAYDPLVYEAANGTLGPGLATSWKLADGNELLDLTLRSGVKFTDGSDVTPTAVKASLDYAKGAGGTNAGFLAGAKITVTGANTLSVKVPAPDPMLPNLLSQYWGIGDIISPTGLAHPSQLSTSAVSQGAGPYIYEPSQSVAGDHYTYVANPNYYDKSRQHFKTIVIRVVGDQQTAVNAAATGQLDVFIGDYTVASQAKSAGLQVINPATLWLGLLFFDRDGALSKPLANIKVRQAINYAIDRDTVAKALFGQYGQAATQIFGPTTPGYSASLNNYYAYDPSKAKQLLAQAGYPNGVTLNVITASIGGFDTVAQAVAGELSNVGITLKITSQSQAPTWVGDVVSAKYPVGVQGVGLYPAYLACQNILLPTGNAILNPFKSSSAELTKLCDEQAAAPASQAAGIDTQISQWVVQNAWFAPVVYSSRVYFARPNIGGVALNVNTGLADPVDYYLTK